MQSAAGGGFQTERIDMYIGRMNQNLIAYTKYIQREKSPSGRFNSHYMFINPRNYWYKTKKRVGDEEKAELSTICLQLEFETPDGKLIATDCANTEGIFCIIQSIPSLRAEAY